MNETRKMRMGTRMLTLLLYATGCVVCTILLPRTWRSGVIGILIGSLTGIMGFNMIQNMVGYIDGKLADTKPRIFRSHMRRYMPYAAIFALSAIAGTHIVALLVGMPLHKCSILIYSWEHRKEDG